MTKRSTKARFLTSQQIALARILVSEGLSFRSIAARIGESYHVTCVRLKEAGLSPWQTAKPPVFKKTARELTSEQVSLAHVLAAQGKSLDAISRLLGVSTSMGWSRLRKLGIRPPRPARSGVERITSPEQDKRICESFLTGIPARLIAEREGIRKPHVWRVLKRNNVMIPPRSYWGRSDRVYAYVSPSGRHCAFRSSWEVAFAREMDRRQIQWAYESHSLRLSDGTTYIPDFWLPECGSFVEIKRFMHPRSHRKIQLMRAEYPQYPLIVITGPALRLYGIRV